LIKYQNGANATQTGKQSPIPVPTGPDVVFKYVNRENALPLCQYTAV